MLKRLKLFNFRNYDHCQIDFQPGLNILLGANGQGKTNLLEAVYYLALLRSFRTTQISNLKQWNQSGFYLEGKCCHKDGSEFTLTVSYGAERKLSVDGMPVHKTSEFITRFICSTFIPEDLEIVKGGALLRRRFLDIALSQLSNLYLSDLQQYNNALRSRNIMLKQPDKYPRNTVTAYDFMMVEKGVAIEKARKEFVDKLNLALLEQSQLFFGEHRILSLKYISGISTSGKLSPMLGDDEKDIYHEILRRGYERDCRDGSTRCGPHRSEMNCLLDGNHLAFFGSEGECRIAALALRFACLKIMQLELGQQEVTLIVDDVLGELDQQHRSAFLQQLEKSGQVIVASTEIPKEIKQNKKIFLVSGGKISDAS
jgi:DNA replication and repair protein RecF